MAQLVGIVTKLTGVVYARDAEGNLRELDLSSEVFQGETLVTAQGSIVEVSVPDAPPIIVPGERELLLNGEVTLAGRNTAEDSMLEEESLEALVAALEDGEGDLLTGEGDLFDELGLEATAAGGAGNEGSSFIRLGRIGYELSGGGVLLEGSDVSEQELNSGLFDADLQLLNTAEDDSTTSNVDDPEDPVEPPVVVEPPVEPVNTAPDAVDDAVSTEFGTPVSGSVLPNDSDPENDPLTITGNTTPANGTLLFNADGTFTYTPNEGFSGSDSFTYTIDDGNGGTDTATVTITVAEEVVIPPTPPANAAPDAVDDAVSTEFGTPVSGSVLPNDSDPENDPLTITGNTTPANGTLLFNADGTFTYTPNEGFSGSDSFTYTIDDGNGGTDTATVTITVAEEVVIPPTPPANAAPDAVDDAVSTEFGTPVSGSVLPNDSDPENDPLTITGNTTPANGTLLFNADGTFTYTPNEGFSGSDSFTYTIDDGNGGTDTATVTITVAEEVVIPPTPPANAAPDAVDDAVSTEFGTPVSGSVLPNDSDPENDPLTITGNTTPANGTLLFNADGTFTYTPNEGFSGSDSFTYTIDDGNGGTDTATVTITVAEEVVIPPTPPANAAPDAVDDAVSTEFGTPVSGSVLPNDSDPENDPLTITGNTTPANGTLLFNADGTFTYTPNEGFSGSDSFTYTIDDGNGGTDTATVTISVADEPANAPPVASNDTQSLGEDTSATISILSNDSDPDGALDVTSITVVSGPINGSVVVNLDGTVTYTPNEDYIGADVFTYTVADDDGAVSNTATVNLSIDNTRNVSSFTDNWVDGVEYYSYASEADYIAGNDPVAGGLTGDQGAPGSFSWDDGEFIVFKIGSVIVGEFSADQLTGEILFIHDIAGLALSNTNADQLENTAIFLQALDADLTDGDLSDGLQTNQQLNTAEAFANGITITAETRAAFTGYTDPNTGEALDLQVAGKGMISDALATQGIEFTRLSEADPDTSDGSQNIFETQAIQHVTDTVLQLADTAAGGERLADDFEFDGRLEDVIDAGDGFITYSSEFLSTTGSAEEARLTFDSTGLLANANPQQVAIRENMEIEIPEGTLAQVTLADGTTRIVGEVVYDDEGREGYIQLRAFDGQTGITNQEINDGLLETVSFEYTIWDWTARETVSLKALDTFKSHLSAEITNVVEGETIEFVLSSSLTFETDQQLTVKFSPEVNGFNFAEYADDFTVPVEYSTDGGATWQSMTQVDSYFAPPYDLPLPVFGFTLPAGADSVLVRIETFDDVLDEDPEGSIDGASGQGIEVIDMIIEGENFYTENLQPGIIDNDPAEVPYVKSDFQIVYEHDGEAVFTITLYDANGNPVEATEDVVVSYQTSDLGAKAGEDYTAVSGTAVIKAGSSTATVTVPIIDDLIIESPDPEFALLNLTGISGSFGGQNVVIGDSQGSLRIYDNDAGVFSVSDVTVIEGAEVTDQGPGVLVTVTRFGAGPAEGVQSVTLSTVALGAGDTAEADDFGTVSVTVDFAPGETEKTVFIPITDDEIVESAETFRVELSNPTNGASVSESLRGQTEDGEATVTIIDNDSPSVIIGDATTEEGSSAAFAVTISQASDAPVDITFTASIADGDTAETEDLDAANLVVTYLDGGVETTITANGDGSYTVPVGVTDLAVRVPAIDDNNYEGSETFTLSASTTNENYTTDDTGQGTIVDDGSEPDGDDDNDTPDDDRPSFSIDDVTVDEDAGTITFTVTKAGSTELTSSVVYTVNEGTGQNPALEPEDYSVQEGPDADALTGTLTFAPGTTTQTITLAINDDALAEGIETFSVNLSNAIQATISDETGIGTITDETDPGADDTITLKVIAVDAQGAELTGSSEAYEGQSLYYKVVAVDAAGAVVTGLDGQNVNVVFSNADPLTAESGDYTPSATTVAIGAVFNAALVDDYDLEGDETFAVSLGDNSGFTQTVYEAISFGTGSVTSTIKDGSGEPDGGDDPADTVYAVISVDDTAISEGENAVFTVKLVDKDGVEVTATTDIDVTLAWSGDAANDGDALVGTNSLPTTVTITAGSTGTTVTAVDDALAESAENLTATITAVADQDDPNAFENLAIGTANSATTQITDETDPGADDTITLKVIAVDAQGAELTGSSEAYEGQSLYYKVVAVDAAGAVVTGLDGQNVNVVFSNADPLTAESGDYTPSATTVAIGAVFNAALVDDYDLEGDETFAVSLGDNSGFTQTVYEAISFGTGSVTSTIKDGSGEPDGGDDPADTVYAVISVDDTAISEGENAVFTVKLVDKDGVEVTATTDIDVTLAWSGDAANDGDALVGTNSLPTTVTITAGSTGTTVTAVDDALAESAENLTATITAVADQDDPNAFENLAIGTANSATTQITDETDPGADDTITLKVIAVDAQGAELTGSSEAYEGQSLYYKVVAVDAAGAVVTGLDGQNVNVVFSNADPLTAESGDYTPSATTVAIGAVFNAALVDDYDLEGDETFAVSLGDNSGFTQTVYEAISFGTGSVTSTIKDGSGEPDGGDDPADTVYAVISVDDTAISEGENAVFTVKLVDKDGVEVTATTDIDVTLAWSGDAANDGDALVGTNSLPTTVTITAGSTGTTVTAVDDALAESAENLTATITAVADQDDPNAFENLAIGTANSATTQITDETDPGADDTITLKVIAVDAQGAELTGSSEAYEGQSLYYKVVAVDAAGAVVTGLDGQNVNVVFSNADPLTAESGDYTPSATTVAIGAVFNAALVDDYDLEGDETFAVSLGDNSGFTQTVYEAISFGTGSVTSTIKDGSGEPDGGDDPADTVYAVISVDDTAISEGENAVFTVKLVDKDGVEVTATTDIDVTLAWSGDAANDGDALVGTNSLPTTVTITAGSTGTTVTAVDDALAESAENLTATITAVADQDDPNAFENLAIGTANSATTQITDETDPGADDTITLKVIAVDAQGAELTGSSEAYEGQSLYYKVVAVDAAGAVVTGLDGQNVNVVFSNADPLTAESGDYTPSATTVAIGAVFNAALVDDYDLEGDETFAVSLGDNSGFTQTVYEAISFGTGSVTSTIKDGSGEPDGGDDPADTVYAVISVDDTAISEGENAVFTVKLVDKDGVEVTATTDIDVTLAWSGDAANDGDALVGTNSLPTTVTITAGSTGTTVTAVDDALAESAENLTATITAVADQDDPNAFENLAIGTANSATTQITDETDPGADDTITLKVIAVDAQGAELTGSSEAYEGQSLYYKVVAVDAAGAVVTGLDGQNVNVVFSNADPLTAESGDYTPSATTVAIGAVFNAALVDDYDLEGDETFAVSLGDNSGFTQTVYEAISFGTGSVTSTIKDGSGEPDGGDDPADTVYAVISVDDTAISEGENAVFTVKLVDKDGVEVTATTDIDVTLAWSGDAANDGDALVGTNSLPTTVTITAGSTGTTVTAVDDALAESAENLTATITAVADQDDPNAFENLAIGTANSATTQITDDDGAPPIAEDDPGAGSLYSVVLGVFDEDGSAATWSNADSNDQSVTIAAFDHLGNAATTNINSSNFKLGVTGQETDGRSAPEQIGHELSTGTSEAVVFSFSGYLDQATIKTSNLIGDEGGGEKGVWIAMLDGTVVATGAVDGDTLSIDTGDKVFNQLRFEATVYTDGSDSATDSSDYFLTGISGTGPATANAAYVTTEDASLPVISSDGLLPNDSDPDGDDLVVIKVNGANVNSGDEVDLPSGAKLTINADGSFTYDPNGAYDNLAAGELGSDSFTYQIEDKFGNSLDAVGGEGPNTDTDSVATATITIIGKGDPYTPPSVNTPEVSISGPQEIDEDAGTATYTISLSNASTEAVSVNYATSDGTAIAGEDYAATSDSVTFEAGETQKTITVAITDDTVDEPDQDYTVTLSNLQGAATLGNASVKTTIIDNDEAPAEVTFAIGNASVSEGSTVEVTITRGGNTGVAASVDVATLALVAATDSAEAEDFTALATQTVSFAAGETTKTITIQTISDDVYEGAETFRVGLSNATATGTTASISTAEGTVTILDDGTGPDPDGPETPDDDRPEVSISGPQEIDEDAGTATYTISLSNASTEAVSVNYATSDGTAEAGLDYTAISGTETFAAGETEKTITVAITDDGVDEADEAYTVSLSNVQGTASLGNASVNTTIVDNDEAPIDYSGAGEWFISGTAENEGVNERILDEDGKGSTGNQLKVGVQFWTGAGGGAQELPDGATVKVYIEVVSDTLSNASFNLSASGGAKVTGEQVSVQAIGGKDYIVVTMAPENNAKTGDLNFDLTFIASEDDVAGSGHLDIDISHAELIVDGVAYEFGTSREQKDDIRIIYRDSDAPIAIDLDGDGIEYLDRDAGVVFTDQSTGESVNTAWVAPEDGMLVIDANNSGTVDEAREYVFTEWSETAQTDMEAVAEVFDTNQDGVLDAQDEQWDQFAVWQDADSDGVTDEGELVSLSDLGVESIALTYSEDSEASTAADGDVVIHGQSEVTFTDGSTTVAEDTTFAISAADVLGADDEIILPASEAGATSAADSVPAGNAQESNAEIDTAMLEADLMLTAGQVKIDDLPQD